MYATLVLFFLSTFVVGVVSEVDTISFFAPPFFLSPLIEGYGRKEMIFAFPSLLGR